jgi:hypothetical protein
MRRDYREDDKRLEALMSQQEVLDLYMSYFRNLPHITKNIIGEVPDIYGQYCEGEITEDEMLEDKDKYINMLLSFINFMWTEMQADYDSFEESIHGLSYVFECKDGTFGEKYDKCITQMERLRLAADYGWFVTPNEVFEVKEYL